MAKLIAPGSSSNQVTSKDLQTKIESVYYQKKNDVTERLEVAKRLFKKMDIHQRGYLTKEEVPQLLIDTYAQLGTKYSPTEEDVAVWMKMYDQDRTGKVTLQNFEQMVLNALNNQGIKLE